MTAQKKVSVILVSKDRPDYLRDALDSLVPQNRYIKEILIFDKSEDQTKASRIKEIADVHSAILYTRPSIVNTSTLRNEGLVKATGDYLCFLDDDDYLFPDYIESQLTFLQNGTSLVFCNYITIKHPQHPLQLNQVRDKYAALIKVRRWTAALGFNHSVLSIQRNAFAFIASFIPIIHGAMFRKDALEKIRFSDQMIFCEDLHFWILFYKNNLTMAFNKSVLAIYRIHENNWSSLFSARHNLEFYMALKKEGAVSGKINEFILSLKIYKFSQWGKLLNPSEKHAVRYSILKSFYLLPHIIRVLPYYIGLKYQNYISRKSLR